MMSKQITERTVLNELEDGSKSVEEIAYSLGYECDMGHIHREDDITSVLRELHRCGKISLTVDRKYEIRSDK